jgi:hypothetical protein
MKLDCRVSEVTPGECGPTERYLAGWSSIRVLHLHRQSDRQGLLLTSQHVHPRQASPDRVKHSSSRGNKTTNRLADSLTFAVAVGTAV